MGGKRCFGGLMIGDEEFGLWARLRIGRRCYWIYPNFIILFGKYQPSVPQVCKMLDDIVGTSPVRNDQKDSGVYPVEI